MRKIIYKTTLLALAAAAVLSGCREKYTFSHGVGLVSEYNVLSKDAGNTPVLVFSNSTWTAAFDKEVSWAYLDRITGTGDGQVKFHYEQNYGRSRAVTIVFNGGGETASIRMWQKPAIADDDVILNLEPIVEYLPAGASQQSVKFNTNLVYQIPELKIVIADAQNEPVSWIKDVRIVDDPFRKGNCTLEFSLEANTGSELRTATLLVSHTDGGGAYDSLEGTTVTSNTLTITQNHE